MNYHDALALGKIDGAHPGGMKLTKKIIKHFDIDQRSRVLDVGCGNGDTSIFLGKNYGCQVFSLDQHAGMISNLEKRLVKEKLPIKAIQGNAEAIPYPDDYFDLSISESVLTFTDINQSLKEIRRVLKPQGYLVIIEMTHEGNLEKFEMQELKAFYNIKKILTEKEWSSALMNAGFGNIEVLKAKTVRQEIEDSILEYGYPMAPANLHPQAEDILNEQSLLLAKYEDKIGYRVFAAQRLR